MSCFFDENTMECLRKAKRTTTCRKHKKGATNVTTTYSYAIPPCSHCTEVCTKTREPPSLHHPSAHPLLPYLALEGVV